MLKLDDFKRVAGRDAVERIRESAEPLRGKHVVNINSTYFGGGVAEMLNSLVILMNNLGIYTEWHLLKGTQSFFNITKKMHNSFQGDPMTFGERRRKIYFDVMETNAVMKHFDKRDDIVVIHDPQPLGLIEFKKKNQPWIWRCHIDVEKPFEGTWNFFLPMISKYDSVIVSMDKYRKPGLPVEQVIIMPSIDPFSLKNRSIPESKVRRLMENNDVDPDMPMISQISRFDKWKNPVGVIRMYREVKKKVPDCQLVLAGNLATDDPEGPRMYSKLVKYAEKDGIRILINKGDTFINALQRASDVVFQNSIREGFALTVSEALWKRTPVIGTNVGGIPLQVLHGETGVLIGSRSEGVKWCAELLRNDELRRKIGDNGHEHVRKNFLTTRHLQDYINLFNSSLSGERKESSS